MLQALEFDIKPNSCPPGAKLSPIKQGLDLIQKSKTLRELLDNLISFLIQCDALQTQSGLTTTEATFLAAKSKELFKLAGVLCNQPDIKLADLLEVQNTRRVAPYYIPKHLPEDRPYTYSDIDPVDIEAERDKLYKNIQLTQAEYDELQKKQQNGQAQHVSLASTLEAENQRRLQFAKKRAPGNFDRKLVMRNRARRFRELGIGALLFKAPESKLLKLRQRYFHEETLAQGINKNKTLHLTPGPINRAFNALSLLLEQIKRLEVNETIQQQIRELLNNVLTKFPDYLKSLTPEQRDDTKQLTIVLKDTLLSGVEALEKQEGVDLAVFKNEIKARITFNLSDWEKQFQAKNPKLFEKTNRHLSTPYLTDAEKEAFRLHIYQGKCYRFVKTQGKIQLSPLSTEKNISHKKTGWVMFVVNAQGEIFVSNHNNKEKKLHSSFMRGGPVKYAGELRIANDGTLLEVSNYSGHYMPDFDNVQQFAWHLDQRGVQLSQCVFSVVNDKDVISKLSQVVAKNGMNEQEVEEKRGKLNELPPREKERLKNVLRQQNEIWTLSEQLKHSSKFKYKGQKLVPVTNYKKYIAIAALVLAFLVAVTLLAAVIVMTKGTIIPFLVGTAFEAMPTFLATAPWFFSAPIIALTTAIALTPPTLVLYLTGGFNWIKEKVVAGWQQLKNWMFSTNEIPAAPPPAAVLPAVAVNNSRSASLPASPKQVATYVAVSQVTKANPIPTEKKSSSQSNDATKNQIVSHVEGQKSSPAQSTHLDKLKSDEQHQPVLIESPRTNLSH